MPPRWPDLLDDEPVQVVGAGSLGELSEGGGLSTTHPTGLDSRE